MRCRPVLLTTQGDQTEQDDETFGHDSTLTQIPKALFGFFSRKPARLATQKPDDFAIRSQIIKRNAPDVSSGGVVERGGTEQCPRRTADRPGPHHIGSAKLHGNPKRWSHVKAAAGGTASAPGAVCGCARLKGLTDYAWQ